MHHETLHAVKHAKFSTGQTHGIAARSSHCQRKGSSRLGSKEAPGKSLVPNAIITA